VYVDETRVYWANQGNPDAPHEDGSIAYCELDGCCSTPIVAWTGTGEPVRITGDATAIYWVTYRTDAIWKMAKP
jgi:hypothetical protein